MPEFTPLLSFILPLPWFLQQFQQVSFLHLHTCVHIICTISSSYLLPPTSAKLFLWKSSVQFISHFFIGSLIFLKFSYLNSLYILVINPLSDVYMANIFSHYVGSLFILEMIFIVVKIFNFMYSHLPILSLSCWAIWVLFRKSWPMPRIPVHFLLFPALVSVSVLTLRSLLFLYTCIWWKAWIKY
jgi:hypothetical protein